MLAAPSPTLCLAYAPPLVLPPLQLPAPFSRLLRCRPGLPLYMTPPA